jgi:ribosomal protein L9
MSNEPIDWEETKRIVAANEEAIKRYERERPARQAKREQRRAEFQAMIEQLKQMNEESIRRSEAWSKRHHL